MQREIEAGASLTNFQDQLEELIQLTGQIDSVEKSKADLLKGSICDGDTFYDCNDDEIATLQTSFQQECELIVDTITQGPSF